MRAFTLALLLALAPLSIAQPLRERVQVRYSKKAELAKFLVTLVPQLKCFVEEEALVLEGSAEEIEHGKDLIARLDLPPDAVIYYLQVFTLEAEEIKEFGAFWRSHEVGVLDGGCVFNKPWARLGWFLSQNEATMLASPRLTGSCDKACGLRLMESQGAPGTVGLWMNFQVHRRSATRMDLTVDLQERWFDWSRKLRTEVELSDGDGLLIRGLAADHAGQTLPCLAQIPIWGPLFHQREANRELMLMVTPNIQLH